MSNKKLTTARYLLGQVQKRRLELLAVRPGLTAQQLAEYRLIERSIKELEHILDEVQPVTLYALTGPPELPNIAKFKKPKTEAKFKINFKPH